MLVCKYCMVMCATQGAQHSGELWLVFYVIFIMKEMLDSELEDVA